MDAMPKTGAPRPPSLTPVLWIGPVAPAELRLARDGVRQIAELHDSDSPAAAVTGPPAPFADRSPAVILLAADTAGRWSIDDVIALAIRWPLAPIVAVAATLVEGRRRSGPALPGIEEVPWHDLPGRLFYWLADRAAGLPGTLGMPATARREERFLEGAGGRGPLPGVSVAAGTAVDLDGLADLVVAAGGRVARRARGRPPLDEPSPLLVWDVGRLDGEHLAWVRMLAANRPGLQIVLLESFPRSDTTVAAMRAGAAAVLGRPASAEAVAGTLARFAGGNGLSQPPRSG